MHWQRNFRLSWWWNDTEPALSETEAWVAGTHAFRLFRQWIGNILRVNRLLSVYTDHDRHALYVKRHEKMFHLMFSFSFFPFFLTISKSYTTKNNWFFSVAHFFCASNFLPNSSGTKVIFKTKMTWTSPTPCLLQPNRDLLTKQKYLASSTGHCGACEVHSLPGWIWFLQFDNKLKYQCSVKSK